MSRIEIILLVEEKGVEPLQPYGHRILNAARLPIPPFFREPPTLHSGDGVLEH